MLRVRDDAVSTGEVRAIEEGKPLARGAEIVRLKPRQGCAAPAFDVERLYKREEAPARVAKGPVKVATAAYRSNWETIFGAPSSNDDAAPN